MNKIALALLRKTLILCAIAAVTITAVRVIKRSLPERVEEPGKADFTKANNQILTNVHGFAHGNTDAATQVAKTFAEAIKTLQADLFKGGSKEHLFSGGEFLTYCRLNPNSVVLMVQVPDLRNYEASAWESLSELAWAVANRAAKDLPFASPKQELIIGLRGTAFYGPIWQGKIGGEPRVKTDGVTEQKRLYPFFVNREKSVGEP